MAILGYVTVNEVLILSVDTDPTLVATAAPIGSLALLDDKTNARRWLKTGSGDTAWTAEPRIQPGFALQANTLPFTDANSALRTDTTKIVWDNTNARLGLGLGAPANPQSTIHIDRGTGVGGHIRFTAGTTTGVTAGDGFEVGIDDAGNAEIRNYENNNINFYTNNNRTMRLNSSGELIIGLNAVTTDISGLSTFPQFQIVGNSIGDVQMAAIKYGADTLPPVFNLLKSRGTQPAQGILLADDEFGRLQFRGSDGVNFQAGASVRAAVDGTPGAGSMPGRLIFMTTPSGSTVPTERLRIDSVGQAIFASNIRLGAGADTTNGNVEFDGAEFLGRQGGTWRNLAIVPTVITSGTGSLSTTSGTFSTITGLTTTPAAGTYLVLYSVSAGSTANGSGDVSVFLAGNEQVETTRNLGATANFGSTATASGTASAFTVLTVNGSQVVDIRFKRNTAGTFSVTSKVFILIPIAR